MHTGFEEVGFRAAPSNNFWWLRYEEFPGVTFQVSGI